MMLPVLGASAHNAACAARLKAAAKEAAAKQPKLIREVMGTEQLLGYEGELGQTFTLGKDMPLNFTLRKVEYSAGRSNIGDYIAYPKGDEKLLIIRYTVQNPQNKPFNYSANYLTFRAVDAGGVTRNHSGHIARESPARRCVLTLNPVRKSMATQRSRLRPMAKSPS
jgi:hypothetical protein